MGTVVVSRDPALVRYVTTQAVTITVSVYNDSDVLTDPSGGVVLTVTHPVGVDTTPTLTHGSTGVYTATVTLDADGRWIFHAQSAGDIVAAERLTLAVEDTGSSGSLADEEVLLADLAAVSGSLMGKGPNGWAAFASDVFPVELFGAVGNGTTDDTAAIAAAITAASASGGVVKFAAKEYCYTALTISSNNVVLEGTGDMGDTGTVLSKTSTTGDGITITSQNSGVRNLMLRQKSAGAPATAGYAIKYNGCFCGFYENLRIADMYDGVRVTGCFEFRGQGTLWLRGMFGTVGLDVDGISGFAQRVIADNPYQAATEGKSHAARQTSHAYVVGDTYTNNGIIFQVTGAGTSSSGGGPTTVPGTTVANATTTNVTDGTATVRFIGRTIDWIKCGSSVGGFTVQTCAVLNGYRAFRQTGGNWFFFNHLEFDHQWKDAVSLEGGSGFRATNVWISSVFTGEGITVGAGYSGDMHVIGGRLFGGAGKAILLQPGPVNCHFSNLNIGTWAGTFGFCTGDVAGVGPKHWSLTNSRLEGCSYGIAILAADTDYFVVTGNDVQGNSTQGIVDGSTAKNKVIRDNPGYDPVVRLTGQTANIGATSLYTGNPSAGLYEVDCYVEVTTVGTTGTLVLTIGYTDAVGATSQATTGINITGTGRASGRFLVKVQGAANITYATSGITTAGTLAYNVSIDARRK